MWSRSIIVPARTNKALGLVAWHSLRSDNNSADSAIITNIIRVDNLIMTGEPANAVCKGFCCLHVVVRAAVTSCALVNYVDRRTICHTDFENNTLKSFQTSCHAHDLPSRHQRDSGKLA